ncbi:MAG: TolC family protein [Spirochaetales bacterium]|jgi:outer membrane protein TolC|nr:TolC family protein [Spirochaetales bacterium]
MRYLQTKYLGRFFLGCVLCLFVRGGLFADTELSLDEAVGLALSRNLGLQRSRIDTQTLKRAKDARWNVLVPGIEASAALNRVNEKPPAAQGGPSPYTAAGSVALRLSLSPATFTGMKRAVRDYERGLISLENARTLLEMDVRKAFYGLLLLEENIKLTRQNILTAEKRWLQADENYRNGLVPELDSLSAKVSLENLRPTLDEEIIAWQEQLELFKEYLGIEPDENVRITGSIEPALLPDLDTRPFRASALALRPDIQELRRIRDVSILNRDMAKQSALLPSLSLGWAYSPALTDPFSSGRWNSRDNFADSGMFTVSLSLAIDNLFPGSPARVSIAALEDDIQKQESRILEFTRQAGVEIETLGRKIHKSRQTIEALLLNEELAQRTYTLTEEAYRQGSKELLTLENAAGELQSARLHIVREKYTCITLILDLEYALGLRFGTLEGEIKK